MRTGNTALTQTHTALNVLPCFPSLAVQYESQLVANIYIYVHIYGVDPSSNWSLHTACAEYGQKCALLCEFVELLPF